MSRNSPSLSPHGFWNGSTRDSARDSRNSGSHDPPRPAKDGFEWVWFPDGYWAERPVPRRGSSKGQGTISVSSAGKIFRWSSRANGSPKRTQEYDQRDLSPKTIQSNLPLGLPQLSLPNKGSGSFSPPRTLPRSPWLTEAAQVQALQHPADQQMNLAGTATLNDQSRHSRNRSYGGLSAKSASQVKEMKPKSSRGLFQRSKIEKSKEALPKPTKDAAVDAAPSYFTQNPIDPPQILTPPAEKEGYVSNWPFRSVRKWFSKAPEESKTTRSSPRASRASTSSLSTYKWVGPNSPVSPTGGIDGRENCQGKNAPPASLRCGLTQTSNKHMEATSVTTPPMKQSAAGNPRSFFMNIKHPPPTGESASSSASSARVAPSVFSYRKGVDVESREWWDPPQALVRRDPVKGISFFEFDMPEHLPSSPMCPANPMHRLEGKGVCVFHGRSKQGSIDDEAGIAEEDLRDIDGQ